MGLINHQTTNGGTKRKDSEGYSWATYEGTKDSHEVQATQMNSKDYDGKYGSHTFYNTKTGAQGVAGPNADRKGK